MKSRNIYLLIFLISTFVAGLSQAQVHISGPLSGVLADTTYIVEDSITVLSGDSLIIEPGAVFLFNGAYDFEIYGYLSAVGAETDSIYFQPNIGISYFGSIVFRSGSSFDSQMSYCRIMGSSTSAINCYYVDITISHCTITGNSANWGGGIYVSNANPTISDCIVSDNQCVNNGGGIYCTGASPIISNCVITGNSSNMGGGGSGRGGGGVCANHSSSPIMANCTITGNYCAENGGGISINDNSHPEITDCLISDNSADSSGGGIFCSSNCQPVLSASSVLNNTAIRGGGIYAEFSADLAVDHCVIAGNAVGENGGGLFCANSNPVLDRCTISGNSAVGQGGGVYLLSSQPILVNTIVEGSMGNSGIYFQGSAETSVTYGDFFNNQGGDFSGDTIPPRLGEVAIVNANGDSCDLYYNIFADPLFVNPSSADFHLQEGSPCIDAGDPASPPDPDNTVADMGAFYFEHVGVMEEEEELPSNLIMVQNYPNPFNPITVISFDLPTAGWVTLEVFDVNGRYVGAGPRACPLRGDPLWSPLQHDWMDAGAHQVTFDGSRLPSGVYIYRLRGGQWSSVGKMVLMK